MNVKVYGEKIIAPCKCGTRYLDKIFPTYENTSELDIYRHHKWKGFNGYFIYRPPMEWLESALHTEIINRGEGETIDDILDRFLHPYGTTHWADKTFQRGWDWLSRNRKVKPIPLSQLSTLLKKLGYTIPPYDKTEFEFHHLGKNWLSKETVLKDIQRDYEMEWEWLTSCIEEEKIYYNKIVNGEWKDIKLI